MTPVATQPALTGARKTAILCLAMGPEDASRILKQLTPVELESVAREIAAIPTVDDAMVRTVLQEYRQAAGAGDRTVAGGFDAARTLLTAVVGAQKTGTILEAIRDRMAGEKLTRLERLAPRALANVLAEEHPQTAAVTLAHFDLKRASRVLDLMPPDLASDVLLRMARLDRIAPELLGLVAEGIEAKVRAATVEETATPGDPARVARLLNLAGQGRDEEILERMRGRDDDLADKIKALMFVFEDLILVEGKGIQRILRDVDQKDLALALKGASEEVTKHITSNMSERAAAALSEEIELLGTVRVKDVEEAQMRILESVRELENEGEVVVRREGGGDEYV